MLEEFVFNGHTTVISNGAVFKFVATTAKKAPTVTLEKNTLGAPASYCPWGDDNLFPQRVAEECRKSTIIPTTLNKIAAMIYGGGLVFGFLDYDADGNEKFIPQMKEKPEILQYLRKTNYERYLWEAALNIAWFRNVFPELILSNDRKKITQLKLHPSRECRWGWQNEKTGLVDKCFISANWKTDFRAESAAQVAVIDPYYDTAGSIAEGADFRYIYPCSYPDIDNKFYHLVDWDSVRQSGWLDFSLQIPAFKKALMKHQATPSLMVELSQPYWDWRYPDYKKMKPEEQLALRKAFIAEFNANMAGTDNAGKTILSIYTIGDDGKPIPGIKVTEIDNKIKTGIYIEDSQEASSHIFTALGWDPSLSGNGPGKQFGAGSGSDKGVAFNIETMQRRPLQDLILQPFGVIRDYNNWDPNLVFRIRNSFMITESNRQQTKKA